jgi:hypothetical protein
VRFDDEEEKWTDIGNGRAREKAGKWSGSSLLCMLGCHAIP